MKRIAQVLILGAFLVLLMGASTSVRSQSVSLPEPVAQTLAASQGDSPAVSGAPPVPPPMGTLPDPTTYDEQIGMTFTQSFTSIGYNVTAVEQTDPSSGTGPAYLLNGLSDSGYWYQVGLSWNWSPGHAPGTGFGLNYEVWDPSGNSIFPTNGYGGLESFSAPVNAGDTVLLNLYFSSTYGVVMLAKDYNTGVTAYETYSAEGASQFNGQTSNTENSQGYFTGLMTEWYHSSAFYSSISPVIYSNHHFALTSAWMWIDEFSCPNISCSNQTVLFSDTTSGPVSYSNPNQLQEFSSHGATEFSNAYELITGPAYCFLTVSYTVNGGGTGYTQPTFTYTYNGASKSVALTQSPATYTVDAVSTWSVTGTLGGSTQTEKWALTSPQTTGVATSSQTIDFVYQHQYRLFVEGGSGGSNGDGWYGSGSTASASSTGVFGRSSGSGQRVTSYSVDGATTEVTPTTGLVSVTVTMSSSHQVVFSSVQQFQVALDGGATAALSSVTSPTISGDNYWYDSGTAVSMVLNGVYDRASGTGTRLVGYQINGGANNPVSTIGTITVLNAVDIAAALSITTTMVTQYQLVLDGGAMAALNTITPPAVSGDKYWYDAGSPVSLTLNGAWGRVSGTGSRLISYSVNGGVATQVDTLGDVTVISTNSISAPQSVTTVTTVQYELMTPTGAVAAVTPPAISGDTGWYDSGTAVTLTYDHAWNTTSQQSRVVATGYSVNGGSATTVAESGNGTFSVEITMNSPQVVNVKSATQYYTSFTFANASGSKAITPSDLQISIDGQVQEVSGFSVWLNNGTTFTVSKLTYEGVDVKPVSPTQYVVTRHAAISVKALVYDASLRVTDFLGLPVSGAQVTMTLSNGTRISGTTNGDGIFAALSIPLGNFTAKVSSLGSSVQVTGDASKQSLTAAPVLFSTSSLALVIGLIAIAIGASVLMLRKRSRSNPVKSGRLVGLGTLDVDSVIGQLVLRNHSRLRIPAS